MIPALIGAATSLIGGAMNRNAQKKANASNSPVGQVKQWEQAGINPLFGISSGGYIPQQATSFGDSFASAGGRFAQQMAGAKEQELRETRLELENEKLKRDLDKTTKSQEATAMQSAALAAIPGVRTVADAAVPGNVVAPVPGVRVTEAAPTVMTDAPGAPVNYTAYDKDGQPLELETEAWGAAKYGQLRPFADDILERNSPRMADAVDNTTRGITRAYDVLTGYPSRKVRKEMGERKPLNGPWLPPGKLGFPKKSRSYDVYRSWDFRQNTFRHPNTLAE